MNPRALQIYTDGSARPKNPGPGGIGIRFIFPDFIDRDNYISDFCFPGYTNTTNNAMELNACVIALGQALKLREINDRTINQIDICSDSAYVVDNFPRAMYVWPRQKWRLNSGAPVLNAQIWKELIKNIQKVGVRVNFYKVKGHSKDENNKAVDQLAKKSASNPVNSISGTQIIRRKNSNEKTERGSVEMLGQRMKVRIITSKYLGIQKEYELRFEVISKSNKLYGKVDFVFSKYPLRPDHEYLILFNENPKYRQIKKVIKEAIL